MDDEMPTYAQGHVDGARPFAEALRDITDHATPLGQDEDGFVATGYLVSVGCIHRALALLTQYDASPDTRQVDAERAAAGLPPIAHTPDPTNWRGRADR